MITKLKYGGERHQADPLGRWAARAAAQAPWADAIELVVPLPLSRRRRRERGFNQAELLAETIATHLGALLRPRGLRKVVDTPPQAGLSRAQRRRNLDGVFRAAERVVRGRRVLLVDDVLTTGASLSEAARTLRRAGARRVDAAVVARAI
jgi:ComF family protein